MHSLSPSNAAVVIRFGLVYLSVCVSVCLSVCLVRAIIFECLDQETPFWYLSTASEYLVNIRRLRSRVKVKVTAAKNAIYEREYTHSRLVGLRLKGILVVDKT